MVHPASHQIPRVRCYSGYCQLSCNFDYGTITLFGLPSQVILLSLKIPYTVLYPGCIATSGLASFPFARRYLENLVWFLFLRLLRCFSSAGLSSYTYLFSIWYYSIAVVGFPIWISTDNRIFAPPRGFSQLVTSFFVSWCQGILRMLFIAWSLWPFRTFVLAWFSWIMWVSHIGYLFFAFDTSCLRILVTLFAIWKNLYFFLLFLFSIFKHLFRRNAWKVDSN